MAGFASTHEEITCINCGETYDAFYSHWCECRYCADYTPQSGDNDASWEEDPGYQVAKEYANRHFSSEAETVPYVETQESNETKEFKSPPIKSRRDSEDGIPEWLYIAGGLALVLFLKWFFDD